MINYHVAVVSAIFRKRMEGISGVGRTGMAGIDRTGGN